MSNFLLTFELDRLSFWIGFFGGVLFWWFIWSMRSVLGRAWQGLRRQLSLARESLAAGTETRHLNDTLQHVQSAHLAAVLFSLDEIAIEPRLLAPPRQVQPGTDPPQKDITQHCVPYMPDWPQLAGLYRAPTLSLAEALSAGANLALIGPAGSGKTFALAHFASQLARRSSKTEEIQHLVPFWLHAADLELQDPETEDLLSPLIGALLSRASPLSARGLPRFVPEMFEQGRALVLLDGLDELAPGAIDQTIDYLQRMRKAFPGFRLVVAASTDYFGGLMGLGLISLPVATWSSRQRAQFLDNWATLWTTFITKDIWPGLEEQAENESGEPPGRTQVEPALIQGWLKAEAPLMSPLELTLKVWAGFAGDMLGSRAIDGLEAYVRRMTVDVKDGRRALEQLALQMVTTMKPAIQRHEAGGWVAEYDAEDEGDPATEASGGRPDSQVPVRRTLPDLIGSGVLVQRSGGRLGFQHPIILGYLAGNALTGVREAEALLNQPHWVAKSTCLHYYAATSDASELATSLVEASSDPLQSDLLAAARWLKDAPIESSWRPKVLHRLAKILRNEVYPLGLRGRVLIAMVASNDPDLGALLRHLVKAPRWSLRSLGALGAGMMKDSKSVVDLTNLLYERSPDPRRAAGLALVEINTQSALDAAATGLLQGDEDLRRAVAEAFANHPEEGYPLLEEGAQHEDLLVRRAVVFGLARTRQEWAVELLETMQVEDEQWVVRNAATQALEEIRRTNPNIPKPLPPLHESPWLIAFAAERGLGLTSGKPARELLLRALKEGTIEERQAAMEYLHQSIDQGMVVEIYNLLYGEELPLREAAYNLLWHLELSGIELPSPVQFGLGYA